MSDATVTLISSLLMEHAIASEVACAEARARYKAEPESPRNVRSCVAAMERRIAALEAQNDFLSHVGREV